MKPRLGLGVAIALLVFGHTMGVAAGKVWYKNVETWSVHLKDGRDVTVSGVVYQNNGGGDGCGAPDTVMEFRDINYKTIATFPLENVQSAALVKTESRAFR